MCDPELTGYLVDLLVDFTHIDRLNAMRKVRGRGLKEIAAMLMVLEDDLPSNPVDRDRTMYRQIGDFTLFWAGVYPEHLRRLTEHDEDVLLDYVERGRRSYAIVSDLADENDVPPSSLFRHLSEDFEYCLYGLGLVRRGWEHGSSTFGGGASELLY